MYIQVNFTAGSTMGALLIIRILVALYSYFDKLITGYL